MLWALWSEFWVLGISAAFGAGLWIWAGLVWALGSRL